MSGGDTNPEVRVIWENVLAKFPHINGGVENIRETLQHQQLRSARLGFSIRSKQPDDAGNLLPGKHGLKTEEKTGRPETATGSMPTHSAPSFKPLDKIESAGDILKEKMKRFDEVSRVARDALHTGDRDTYNTMMAALQALMSNG